MLAPESYAALLDELGFTEQSVRLQVYGHHLRVDRRGRRVDPGYHAHARTSAPSRPTCTRQFVDRYRARLLDALGEHAPFFYTFKRILFWARLPEERSPYRDPGPAGGASTDQKGVRA